jgi:hypothetical protein
MGSPERQQRSLYWIMKISEEVLIIGINDIFYIVLNYNTCQM